MDPAVFPIVLGLYFLIVLGLYFLPTSVASLRRHPNAMAIFLLNLLLGWTMLGWVIALVWSATHIDRYR